MDKNNLSTLHDFKQKNIQNKLIFRLWCIILRCQCSSYLSRKCHCLLSNVPYLATNILTESTTMRFFSTLVFFKSDCSFPSACSSLRLWMLCDTGTQVYFSLSSIVGIRTVLSQLHSPITWLAFLLGVTWFFRRSHYVFSFKIYCLASFVLLQRPIELAWPSCHETMSLRVFRLESMAFWAQCAFQFSRYWCTSSDSEVFRPPCVSRYVRLVVMEAWKLNVTPGLRY